MGHRVTLWITIYGTPKPFYICEATIDLAPSIVPACHRCSITVVE